MKVTVCELPHEAAPLAEAWTRLCEHTAQEGSDFVLLPELAFVGPLWEKDRFDATNWENGVADSNAWVQRLSELHASHVVSTRPVTVGRRYFNEGFCWSRVDDVKPLRRKYFLPNESGGWEARWFARGDREFPRFKAGDLYFGLNICTELWAVETYASYASMGVHAILCPRATATATTVKWLSAGTVAAVRSGAYCLSSNRVHLDGSCGGRGWIISPDGAVLANTSPETPFRTLDIDVDAIKATSKTYPRYVFGADTR